MEMRSRTAAPGEAGMVTAEIAVALPAVVLVLLLVLSAVCAGVTQLRVTDAARVAARQAAIGSDDVEGAAVHAGGAVRVDVERGDIGDLLLSVEETLQRDPAAGILRLEESHGPHDHGGDPPDAGMRPADGGG